jgi:hypothetical protein
MMPEFYSMFHWINITHTHYGPQKGGYFESCKIKCPVNFAYLLVSLSDSSEVYSWNTLLLSEISELV